MKECTGRFYDKVKISDSLYSVEDPYKLPTSLQPEYLATNKDEHPLVFQSRDSPLSNFHASKFTVAVTEYNCMKQYLVESKCKVSNDKVSAHRVMMEEDPVKQKAISRQVNLNMQVWEAHVKDTLMAGLTAKFLQTHT